MTRNEALSYCAGLIDGEGSLCITKRDAVRTRKSPYYEVSVSVLMTKLRPLQFLRRHLGGSITAYPRHKDLPAHYKDRWQWRVWSKNAGYVAGQLLPFLVLKSPQARNLLAFRRLVERSKVKGGTGRCLPATEIARREALSQKMRRLNA